MKKQTLLLLSGGMLAIASCNNSAPAGGGMSQAQIDSTVNARVDAIRTELTAQNDSLINVMAQTKADSMIAAMKGGGAAASSVKTASAKPRHESREETKPTTVGNGKPSMNGNTAPGTVGNGKPGMNNTNSTPGTVGNGKPDMRK